MGISKFWFSFLTSPLHKDMDSYIMIYTVVTKPKAVKAVTDCCALLSNYWSKLVMLMLPLLPIIRIQKPDTSKQDQYANVIWFDDLIPSFVPPASILF